FPSAPLIVIPSAPLTVMPSARLIAVVSAPDAVMPSAPLTVIPSAPDTVMPLAPVIVKPANAGTELSKSTSASAISWLIVLANLRLINHKPSSQSDKTVTCFLAIGEKRKPRQRADSIQAAYLVLLRSPCNFVLGFKGKFQFPTSSRNVFWVCVAGSTPSSFCKRARKVSYCSFTATRLPSAACARITRQ